MIRGDWRYIVNSGESLQYCKWNFKSEAEKNGTNSHPILKVMNFDLKVMPKIPPAVSPTKDVSNSGASLSRM